MGNDTLSASSSISILSSSVIACIYDENMDSLREWAGFVSSFFVKCYEIGSNNYLFGRMSLRDCCLRINGTPFFFSLYPTHFFRILNADYECVNCSWRAIRRDTSFEFSFN